ncbi:MAG: purine-nucleoside phosphorylase [Lachnospiraceae bacterium]|nr:purine-nucleoside phosphorylase [Lachnospiraceae bacterium]
MATKTELKLEKAVLQVKERTKFQPLVALVLGSGLGDFAKNLRVECTIPYSEIEGFPVSTVAGHDGRFIFGWLDQVPVVCMKGRVHFYEGYEVSDVVMPIRLMKRLGAKFLFLTNAAGGLNEKFQPGDLMMIRDHISFFVPNPLIGPNPESLGTRFPDMSNVYDRDLQDVIWEVASQEGIRIQKGVYTQLTGPSYESPAEIKALRALGTDAVGMSTVVEAIAANHAGMKICGISCISNLAAGMSIVALNHKEVQETADRAAAKFTALVSGVIRKMGEIEGI